MFNDNSFRVYRQDNNKLILTSSSLNLDKGSTAQIIQQIGDDTLAYVKDSKI